MAKTLFFSVPSKIIFHNYLLPKGGVAELLLKRIDIRVVFLTLPPVREAVQSAVMGATVEVLEKMSPTTFIERLFFFFYSFLIFTSTTRLLATFGARADAPPAGGNRHMVFVKSFIANTFGRSGWVKYKMVPWLYGRIFKREPYSYLFEKYKPDLVFLPNIAFYPDIELVREARRRKVPTVAMPANWDHFNKYFIPQQSDHLLIQNDAMRREAVVWQGYKENQIETVGFPQFDSYARPEEWRMEREAFFKTLNIPATSKLILFISGSVHYLDEPDILKTMSDWIDQGKIDKNAYIMVRNYPGDFDKDKFQDLQNNPRILFNSLQTWDSTVNTYYYNNLLYHADVVVSVYSTTALEVAMFDKPIMTIGFDAYKKRPAHQSIERLEKLSHFKNVLDTGSVSVIRTFDELLLHIKKYFADRSLDRDKRRLLVEKMCYRSDGRAAERIVEFLVKHIS